MRHLLAVGLFALSACLLDPNPGGNRPDGGADAGLDGGFDGSDGGDNGDGGNGLDGGDGGTSQELPDRPTLDQLAAYWDKKACHVYACVKRMRETPEICERARTTDEDPFSRLRRAQAAVAAGRAAYDWTKGATCATYLRALSTEFDCFGENAPKYLDVIGSYCSDVLEGLTPDGAPCEASQECFAGAACVFDRTPDCTGECLTWLKVGESCDGRWRDCEPNTFCNKNSVCEKRKLNPDGYTCFDQGESCKSGKCFNYQCRTVSPLDGECIEQGDCASGLYCRPLPASTGYQGICKEPAGTGKACSYVVYCKGNQPCAGFFRRYNGGWTEGTCTGRPADVGEYCVPLAEGYDYGDTGCFGDLTCNPETTKCEEPPAVGEPCAQPGNRCGLDMWCDGENCRAKKPAGEEAAGPAECLQQFNSYEKKCYDNSQWDRCRYY